MANYTIIGGDEKEYGPVSADDVRQWIAEDRLSEKSMVKAEGEAEFRPLRTFPEFAGAFASKAKSPGVATSSHSEDWSERDYDLDMAGCISRGWSLFKSNMGLLFVVSLLVLLIEGVISGLGSIPLIGPVFSIANLVVAGPLMGGLYFVFIQTIRGGTVEAGDVFTGFRRAFVQLMLGHIVPALLAGLCLIPVIILLVVTVLPLVANGLHGHMPDPQTIANQIPRKSLILIAAGFFVCAIPMIYLQICWAFTLPLIMDKGLSFWTAMGTSRKMVGKHWWHVFGLMILISLVNVLGLLMCCVGLLFTLPIGFAALMYAYETIFAEGQTA